MQNIDCHLIGYITEYLESHEQICLKFINKSTCEILEKLNFKIQEPSFKNKIPLNIVHWLIDNLKISDNFQSSCCNRLCFEKDYCKLYECLDNKNFSFSISFLQQCLSEKIDDIILNCIMSRKYTYNFTTIYMSAIMNNKRVLKWCLRNKKLCLTPDMFYGATYDLLEFACKTEIDNISTVKYLLKNNFKINRECILNCVDHDNINIFKYILNKVKYDLSICFNPNELMNMAIEKYRLDFMKYIKIIYDVRISDISFIYYLVKKYKIDRDRNIKKCIEWLLENGKYVFQEDIEIQLIHLDFNV